MTAKEFCNPHYKRWKKYGDPLFGGLIRSQHRVQSSRFVEIDDSRIDVYQAEQKYGVKADVIWLRVEKLGWTARQAVGLDKIKSKKVKGIFYRDKYYVKQEDLYSEFSIISSRSMTTMRIAMAALRKSGEEITDERIDEVLFGKWQPDEKGGFLYRVTCIPSGKVYIGITSRPIIERWNAHISEANAGVKTPLKNAIRDFGLKNFVVEELGFYKTSKELKAAETKEILEHNSLYPFGLNSNKGGTLGGIDRIPIFFEGKKFRSLSDLARTYGLSPRLLQSRIRQDGLTIENALKLGLPRRSGKRLPRVNGESQPLEDWKIGKKVFQSLAEVSKFYGVPSNIISMRLSSGWLLKDAVKPFGKINCLECGRIFQQKKTDHKFCSTKCKEARRSHSRRSKKPGVGNRRITIIKGRKYESDLQIETIFGVNRQRFRALVKKGISPEKAIEQLLDSRRKSDKKTKK